MAPIIEKEDEEYEANKLNFVVCENVKHLVEFSLEMLSNYSQLKQIFGQNENNSESDIKETLKQFETNESQFWRQWQSRYLEGFEKIKKIEIDMKEEHKMNPESSREMVSLIFTQAFKPVADLIEDRLA